jgi:L-threonylcarbamoyladenylate synthase
MAPNFRQAKSSLLSGGIAVIPTDTIYGLVGKALDKAVVERIYKVKKRSPHKPFVILISNISDLALFDIKPDKATKDILSGVWPGQVSVILPCPSEKFSYLHRGTETLAFRLPDKKDLVELLKSTGPLVAPSANPQSLEPARTIKEAKKYFGDEVDFFVDGGELNSPPSTLIKIIKGNVEILREGAVKINKLMQ